jgi:2-oxoglutarate ferredoxin oxidoreductase subunit beta
VLRIRKLGRDYDPINKMHALTALHEADQKGEVLTGVLYLDTGSQFPKC